MTGSRDLVGKTSAYTNAGENSKIATNSFFMGLPLSVVTTRLLQNCYSYITIYIKFTIKNCKKYINKFVDTGDTGRHTSTQNNLVEYNNNLAKY